MPADPTERLMSGASWNDFCETLKTAGNVVLSRSAPADPLNRAEGYRYLGRIVRAGLEAFFEHADPLAPTLFRPVHETVKMGADNPDNYYQWATISGEHEYRIRGQRGTVHYLGLGTYAGTYGAGGRMAETGYVEGKDLQLEPDGSFQLLLSCRDPGAGNWLPMEPDTSSLIVRQTALDRGREQVARLSIERIGGASGPTPLTPERVDQALTSASRLVVGAAMMFASWAEGFRKRVNELPLFDSSVALAAHGDPNIVYYHGYWELAPDQALLVEVTPPPCDYWNFQLNNHWMESLDYLHHRVAINKHDARLRPDGSLRIVVAHRDPGVDNWLETAGHSQGTMCLRWVRAEHHPQPSTRVVALHELADS
jgi:hypothetical protein